MAHSHDDISLTYFRKDFEKYSWEGFRQDVIAGLSVAMLTVPQAMAYSLVAGLPISTGLFAAIFSSLIVALFGSSRHLIVGPSNAISILIQAGIAEILFTYYRGASADMQGAISMEILTQLLLLVGLIQILAAFFKLGRLTHFVSHSVIVGYVAGVALALVINQLFSLLGVPVPADLTSLYERGIYVATHLQEVNWPTGVVGIICLLMLLGLRRWNRHIPAGAIMLAFVALCTYLFEYGLTYLMTIDFHWFDPHWLGDILMQINLVGDIKGDGIFPPFGWPHFNTGIMNNLLPLAFAIALLSVIETISASKSIAANSGQRLAVNQEIFGLGLGNLFSSFIGALPVSGSLSRSAISYENGAKTRLASVVNSVAVAFVLLAFAFLVRRIPTTAFAALLIVSAAHIVNFKQLFLCVKATRSDAFVLLVTFASCIFFSLDMAFYIGVVMSITLYLKKAAVPQLAEFTVDEEGNLHSIEHCHLHEPRKIRFVKVEGELFFGAADLFHTALKSVAEDDTTTKILILQLKNARDIDATACLALQQLFDYLKGSNRHLIACGLTHQIWDVLSDSGMIDIIGKPNLFIFDERHPHLSVQRAFKRAYDLLNIDETKVIPMPQAEPEKVVLAPADIATGTLEPT